MIMIEINDISKVFRTSEVETVALNHVSLNVEEGEFVQPLCTFRLWKIYFTQYPGTSG